MELRPHDGGDGARLELDPEAAPVRRLAFTDEDHREAWGITLEFDGDGHLVALDFAEPERQVPAGLLSGAEGGRVTFDSAAGAAYVYLQRTGDVADTLAFGEWGINLDFDPDGRVLGIEFQDADVAPAALLADAELLG